MIVSPQSQQNSWPHLQVIWLHPSAFCTSDPHFLHFTVLFAFNHAFVFDSSFFFLRTSLFFTLRALVLLHCLQVKSSCQISLQWKQKSVLHDSQCNFGKSG